MKDDDNETPDFLEEIYKLPKTYAKMVANRNVNGFLLYGEAGLGKSYSVKRAFIEEEKPFVLLTGHITPLELYTFLYEHRTENIVLDDINLLESKINLNMLKAGLENGVISYHTSNNRLKIPSNFTFTGTITLCLNKKAKNNEDLKAVESRILNYNLKMDYETKIKVLQELTKQDYKDLTLENRQEVFSFIKENTNGATKNLNLRLLFVIYEMFRFSKQDWQELALGIIENDEYAMMIYQGITGKDFVEETGLSLSTYKRLKKDLGLSRAYNRRLNGSKAHKI